MSEAIKPTPGEWLYGHWIPQGDSSSGWVDIWTKNADGTRSIPFAACKHMDQHANARLIAEAGTVFHNTGLSPVQLVEMVKELRAMLHGVLKMGRGSSGRIIIEGWQEEVLRAALAKCKGVK